MNEMWNPEKYIQALKYAARAHHGQKVPGTDLPYVVHIAMVAMEVLAGVECEPGLNGDLAVQCALLHDVIEDADVSFDDLAVEFGTDVAAGVEALSKERELKSKTEKMKDSLARIRRQPKEIWVVKLADRITNLQPPPAHWSTDKIAAYKEEAEKILHELGDASPYLAARFQKKLDLYPGGE